MKKISLISGVALLVISILFLTGVLDFNDTINKAIVNGNRLFAANEYDEAFKTYKRGLDEDADSDILKYNLGQTSYALKDYQKAIDYFVNSSTKIDRYYNSGESCYLLANNIDDINQKIQYLNQALEIYKNGIIMYPENVEMKYNYEFMKSIIDELNNEKDNDKSQSEDNDQSEDNNQNQDNQQENDNQDGNEEEQKDSESNNNKNSDKEQDNKNGEGNNDVEQNEQKDGQEDKSKDSNSNQSESSDTDQTDEEVMNILEMLEQQEESSLKNNQQVKGYGKEDEYDW